MKRMYKKEEVKMRAAMIQTTASGGGEGNDDEPSYTQAFTDPTIRGSAWIGFNLAMLQQWTGINTIIFYSS